VNDFQLGGICDAAQSACTIINRQVKTSSDLTKFNYLSLADTLNKEMRTAPGIAISDYITLVKAVTQFICDGVLIETEAEARNNLRNMYGYFKGVSDAALYAMGTTGEIRIN